jgi:Dynamin family
MSTNRSALLDGVNAAVAIAADVYRGTEAQPAVDDIVRRLREPLRIAIAGRVKAGKSTLLNAFVGEELAATDAGECTKIVTWYRHGDASRVLVTMADGSRRQVGFERDRVIRPDLSEVDPDQIERMTVEWPLPLLKSMILIDTPGLGSLSTDTSALTVDLLTPGAAETTPADAVIYLTRHLHASDVDFLRSFHEDEFAQPSPIDCIGVLSRADEIAVGGSDPLLAARRVAARYTTDPRLRRLVQQVVPVAGLLAQAGASLTEDQFQSLRSLVASDADALGEALLSVDRFTTAALIGGPPAGVRAHLVDRLGMHGVRLCLGLVASGNTPTASSLSNQLIERSGMRDLRRVLLSHFAERSDLLKARSGLAALERLVRTAPARGSEQLIATLDRVNSAAHELAELRLLTAVRMGDLELRESEQDEVERLAGLVGASPHARLGLPVDAPLNEIRQALDDALTKWRRRGENPMSTQATVEASRVIVRTCEGLLLSLPAQR